ncbi:ATP-binding cassette domain-containing protein [Maridesulfovibrio hydrothermalis]|uniref:ABC transporter related n=1 Tax=Maridesulfovibrio hydrothermalis AM13 = DSM 14728 TaxID=1121451 RepID=L0RBK5_9BACT|nr:ATP-binding cassette domain-containing protein [Maridesulfovibrio hydrothermalis]CCO24144.1 ABC transporter related [Maridesulfovibrio hydrothermalis AM13 = DSM 14728]
MDKHAASFSPSANDSSLENDEQNDCVVDSAAISSESSTDAAKAEQPDRKEFVAPESVGLFGPGEEDEKGSSLVACLQKVADKFGIVVTENSLQLGSASSLNEYLRLQADNMGIQAEINQLPPKIDGDSLPLIVQYQDGSFAVIEEKVGRRLALWNGRQEIIKNKESDLSQFKDWSCSLQSLFETDKVPFLSRSWFTGQVGKMWPLYSQVIMATLIIHCFTLVIPLLMGLFYDRILPNLAENSLRVLITGAIFVLFFDYILKNVRTSLVEKAALRVERDAEPQLLAQILDTTFSKLPSSSGHLTHAVQEFSRIKSLFTTQLVVGTIDFFFLFFFLFIIYLNSGMLFAVPAVISFLVLIVSIAYGFFIDNNVSAQSKLQSRKTSFLNEIFQGVESIKTTNAARLFVSRWTTEVEKSGEMSSKYRIAQARCSMTTGLLGQLNSAGLLIVAFFLIKSGEMSSGGLLATMVLSGRCIAVSASVANLITTYLFARRSYKDLKELLSLEKETCETKQFKIQNLHGAVRFDSVSFRYHPEAPYALENISFETKPGEKVGIIGPMGSGKSTLLKLLAGLAAPTEGLILLDGHNMAFLNIEKVREFVGVVPQSPVLFHGTLEFNLLMGARTVTQDTLLSALTISGIDKFISQHPLGLKMQILEGGKNLSRGQRQAVAIARALIGNPPLMLLDEPTSSMDSAQEKMLIKRINSTMGDKSLFIVTHRPQILQTVDRIIVVDQGKIVADGPRDAIIAKLSNPAAAS